jgi:hypothetical protein
MKIIDNIVNENIETVFKTFLNHEARPKYVSTMKENKIVEKDYEK